MWAGRRSSNLYPTCTNTRTRWPAKPFYYICFADTCAYISLHRMQGIPKCNVAKMHGYVSTCKCSHQCYKKSISTSNIGSRPKWKNNAYLWLHVSFYPCSAMPYDMRKPIECINYFFNLSFIRFFNKKYQYPF